MAEWLLPQRWRSGRRARVILWSAGSLDLLELKVRRLIAPPVDGFSARPNR